MIFQRPALALARRVAVARPIAVARPAAVRSFASTRIRAADKADPSPGQPDRYIKPLEEIKSDEDLLGPGGEVGTIPTDLEQSTGLERLEILGKMQGVDIFDMRPLDTSRKGTMDNPVIVRSAGEEQHAGCTGVPADTHHVVWLRMDRARPLERCPECGNVLQMEYIGPPDDPHDHHHHHDPNQPQRPKDLTDYLKPEYYWN